METKQEVIEAIKKFKQERQLTKAEQFLNTIVPQQKENIQSEEVEDVQEAIPWPEDLPEAAYHGLIGEIVGAIEPYTEADNVAILMSFLTTIGNYIGKNIYTKVAADTHGTNIFTLLIGDTAKARKGTSLGPVREVFKRIDEEYIKTKNVEGLASGEGLIWAIRDKREDYIKDKKTGEFVKEIVDLGVEDKRLLVTESEFATILKRMQREGNVLSPIIRQAWDGYKIQSLSKNNPAIVTGPHVSIIGHITVEELRNHLRDVELFNGFANRFIWQCVRRSKLLPEGPVIPDTIYNEIIQKLVNVFRWARENKGEIRRDDEATEFWKEAYPILTEGKDGVIGAITSRAEAQVLRLSLIYAILDKSKVIRKEHIEGAIAIWQRSEQSIEFVFGDSTGDEVQDKIIEALKRGPMTQTEIFVNVFNRKIPAIRIKDTLQRLSAKGLISGGSIPTKGRPKTVWELNEQK
ncbi:DUF3987 domain-containing protein [Caldanaerobacter subterraneus]|uniref:Uncharacterized protein DUF3987 n=1 Tax=Caldanaerobacter subterraneus TaxID=911092 RepID=A0A4R2JG88_9THEO|nr:DUF3987 domain-containing protein [Caldanaerobacter subterraneus]TCO57647.1 uncharacterized protein DUF3987 [Caldanaerobacter subterraneus]